MWQHGATSKQKSKSSANSPEIPLCMEGNWPYPDPHVLPRDLSIIQLRKCLDFLYLYACSIMKNNGTPRVYSGESPGIFVIEYKGPNSQGKKNRERKIYH